MMVPRFYKSYKRQSYSGRFGIWEQLEVPRAHHVAMVQVFRRLELQLLVGVGEVHLETVSGALFFDGVDQIFDIPGVASVLFQVPAAKNHC